MKLIIASNNKNKIREIKDILGGFFGDILSMKEAGINHETVEDGETFMENALKKAREVCAISGCAALADDSGLCVDALNGAPGVYSARYSGTHGDDKANNEKLLRELSGISDRKAHFTAAAALCFPDGRELTAEGSFYGEIALKGSGDNGFGYDPLFYVPAFNKTAAELSEEEKNRISHRAIALKNLCEKLKNMD